METVKLIAFNTLSQLIAKAVNSISTLLITWFITTGYGAAGFGNFNTIITYIFLFYVLVDFGLNAIAIQNVVTEEGKTKSIFGNLIGIRLVLSILTSFIALTVLAFGNYSPEVKVGIIIALGLILSQGLFNSANAIFQAKMRYELSAAADIFGSLTTLFLAYLAVQSGAGVVTIVLIYVIGGFVRVGVSFFFAKELIGRFRPEFNFSVWRPLIWTALPLGITLVFSQIIANIDKQIIYLSSYSPHLGLNREVAAGAYGLAYKFLDLVLVFPTFFMNAVYPIMIKKNHAGTEVFSQAVRRLASFLIIISVIGAILGIILSPWIIDFFRRGQDGFEGSTLVLQILLSGLPLFYLTGLMMWVLVTWGKQRLLIFIYGFTALFNLSTNLYFVPRYGYLAAAVITLISEAIILVSCGYLVLKQMRSPSKL